MRYARSTSKDTIAAIATPIGKGGIGVIRVSGPKSHDICRKLTNAELEPRKAKYVCFQSAQGTLIDKGIAIYFKGPESYTGEDVIEYHMHGNQVLLDMLLEEIITLGARVSNPGEFTERAFLNEKLDLLQAEAVADLIDSHSKKAARSAMQSLEGVFSREVNALKDQVFKARALVEAALDFPDEGDVIVEIAPAIQTIKQTLASLDNLLNRAESGRKLSQTPVIVIIGPPNVGKSCLMNHLSGHDSAIVSNTPGTTRDTIREEVLLNTNSYTLIDTAGLRETNNEIEQEGINRTNKAIGLADMVLKVFDINAEDKEAQKIIEKQIPETTESLTVWNKIDLCEEKQKKNTDKEIYISAKTGVGIDALIKHISESQEWNDNIENPFCARQRHVDALNNVKELLQQTLKCAERNEGVEVLAENLRQVLSGFDEILGKTTTDDILGEIFSRFCIGKSNKSKKREYKNRNISGRIIRQNNHSPNQVRTNSRSC